MIGMPHFADGRLTEASSTLPCERRNQPLGQARSGPRGAEAYSRHSALHMDRGAPDCHFSSLSRRISDSIENVTRKNKLLRVQQAGGSVEGHRAVRSTIAYRVLIGRSGTFLCLLQASATIVAHIGFGVVYAVYITGKQYSASGACRTRVCTCTSEFASRLPITQEELARQKRRSLKTAGRFHMLHTFGSRLESTEASR